MSDNDTGSLRFLLIPVFGGMKVVDTVANLRATGKAVAPQTKLTLFM